MGFVRQHSLFGGAAAFALLAADFFPGGDVGRNATSLELLDLIEQKAPGDETVESLLAGGLAFDLKAGGSMQEHDAGGRFVDVLAAVAAGSHKRLLNIGFPHAQRGHAFGQLIGFFRVYGK